MADARVMNFFEHQDRARKKTGRLILLFVVAVLGMAVAVHAVVVGFVFSLQGETASKNARLPSLDELLFDPVIFGAVFVGLVLLIGIASLVRVVQLRGGGASIAAMLGGRSIDPATRDPNERRLMNVIEEMSIASGVPMPDVFVMDDEGAINAFAAGYSPDNAAIAVTRGTLERLSRDELQGVMAHEFSHILNGDMRINIRLMGVLFGILALTVIGRILIRAGSGGRSSRSKGTPALMLAGLALLIIGYLGAFIGRIIKAAVSRQREFLADASAVQFTRNPAGIAGALKKIAGLEDGAIINAPKAEEASHLFFGQGIRFSMLSGLFSTHPPIVERIQRVDPSFNPELPGAFDVAPAAHGGSELVPGLAGSAFTLPVAEIVSEDPGTIVTRVGSLDAASAGVGEAIHRAIPEDLRDAARTGDGACAVVFALLFAAEPSLRAEQITLARRFDDAVAANAARLFEPVGDLDPRARLPLVELAAPALRNLAPDRIAALGPTVEALVAVDGQVTLFEWCLQWLIAKRASRGGARPTRVAFESVKPLIPDMTALLAQIARAGNPADANAARAAFEAGVARIADLAAAKPTYEHAERPAWDRVGRALDRLAQASFEIRGTFIDAAAHTAFADGHVTVNEADLLRVVASALACPLPPFVNA